jgi:hypothetical protein
MERNGIRMTLDLLYNKYSRTLNIAMLVRAAAGTVRTQ